MNNIERKYFTIETEQIDTQKSWIYLVDSNNKRVDWCSFAGFEHIGNNTWRINVDIFKQYQPHIGEPNSRYAYITGLITSNDRTTCKKITINDGIRVKQISCVKTGIEFISNIDSLIRQKCEYLIFENSVYSVTSPCIDESISFASSDKIKIVQECYVCKLLMPSGDKTFTETCNSIWLSANNKTHITNRCPDISLKTRDTATISKTCETITFIGPSGNSLVQDCDMQ